MPVPHFNIKITQRSKGKSAVAGAAYQAGEKLFSEYDQKTKNYTCKKEVVYTEIMLPPNAPPEYADRAALWNSVEEIEKQWNSQLARRFVAALPREVPMELLPQMKPIRQTACDNACSAVLPIRWTFCPLTEAATVDFCLSWYTLKMQRFTFWKMKPHPERSLI